jgi:NAD-dependent dihydropyrimidine dehydrogenase PreA subunit
MNKQKEQNKKEEILKKIRSFMILNLEIKKLMKELDVEEDVYNAYEEITKMVRDKNIKLYRKFYNAGKEIYYEEYGKKRKDIVWFPTIDSEKCEKCEKCISFCPKGVYDIENNKVIVKYPYNCIINCNACSYMCCENNAIIFPKEKIIR